MKLKYLSMLMLGASLTGLTACNDFLDKVPESAVTPDAYFMAEADLAAYSINLYNFNTIPTGQPVQRRCFRFPPSRGFRRSRRSWSCLHRFR